MNMIFLSASIPDKNRHPDYFETADFISIRDAVKALATVVIPKWKLVWGGHPAISALIRNVLKSMNTPVYENVTLYQSAFFAAQFPKDNQAFERVIVVPADGDKPSSLQKMRKRMLLEDKNLFNAAFFIGGMDGVEREYEMFVQFNPQVPVFPIGSTGAAARRIFDRLPSPDQRLLADYAYMDLFKSLLDHR